MSPIKCRVDLNTFGRIRSPVDKEILQSLARGIEYVTDENNIIQVRVVGHTFILSVSVTCTTNHSIDNGHLVWVRIDTGNGQRLDLDNTNSTIRVSVNKCASEGS